MFCMWLQAGADDKPLQANMELGKRCQMPRMRVEESDGNNAVDLQGSEDDER